MFERHHSGLLALSATLLLVLALAMPGMAAADDPSPPDFATTLTPAVRPSGPSWGPTSGHRGRPVLVLYALFSDYGWPVVPGNNGPVFHGDMWFANRYFGDGIHSAATCALPQ